MRIRVRGERSNGRIRIEEESQVAILATGGEASLSSTTINSAAVTGSGGVQRTLVVMVNYQDNPQHMPWSAQQVGDVYFGLINDYILENSYGEAWVEGDVFGWYTAPTDSISCDQLQMEATALEQASLAGAVPSAYDHHVFVMPQNSNCSWSGTATVGGTPSRTWINGDLAMEVTGHEFGHALGLYHSHSLACQGVVIADTCTQVEYGDGIDIMGWSSQAHFNAFNKERLGWMGSATGPVIEMVSSSGSYVIDALESVGGNPGAIKVVREVDSSTGSYTWFYLEYRQPVGFDSVIASPGSMMDAGNVLSGLLVRTGRPDESGNTSVLLDMTPETYDLYARDPALPIGESYYDAEAGITITPTWRTEQSIGVDLYFDAENCVTVSPEIHSPSADVSGSAGSAQTYSFVVRNANSTLCEDAQYTVSAAAPTGWTVDLDPGAMALASGAEQTVIATVTPPGSAAEGSYQVAITVQDEGGMERQATTTVLYSVIASSGNSAPLAVDDSVSISRVEPVVIDVLANDYDADLDQLVVTAASDGSKGTVTIESDGRLRYVPGRRFKNQDSFSYRISDGLAVDEASVTVSLVKSEESKGGKGGGRNKN